MDKSGSFIGYMFVQTEKGVCNLSVELVENGLASVHFTAEKGNYYNQLCAAEKRAKQVCFFYILFINDIFILKRKKRFLG